MVFLYFYKKNLLDSNVGSSIARKRQAAEVVFGVVVGGGGEGDLTVVLFVNM